MATAFTSRSIVNGGTLRQFVGKNVSIMLRVESETHNSLKASSTDGQTINVSLNEPLGARKGSWVEVIGTPTGGDTLRAKEAIFFDDESAEFDEEAYNMTVLFLNNCKEIFKHG